MTSKKPFIIHGGLSNITSTMEKRNSRSLNPVYKTIAFTPSSFISNPTANRKLLVLDLNGTLVFRPKKYVNVKTSFAHDGPSSARVRVIHPRTYMTPFREYLFHPQTKKWLDTMVWSSAQPHSVNGMIQHSFGDHQGELKAVWARDTLDLDPVAYNKKSVTIKDLTKLWKAFPLHSAKSTLLVDDSTQKARLQPWNHIFVKEYGQAERRSDLDYLRKQNVSQGSPGDKGNDHHHDLDVSDLLGNMTLTPSFAKTSLASQSSSTGFDSILLAVIGILDVLKHQDNVSGWLRSGGIVLCGAEGVTGGGGGGIIGDRWFDTAHIVEWWANRGRAALAELNIEVVAGALTNR